MRKSSPTFPGPPSWILTNNNNSPDVARSCLPLAQRRAPHQEYVDSRLSEEKTMLWRFANMSEIEKAPRPSITFSYKTKSASALKSSSK